MLSFLWGIYPNFLVGNNPFPFWAMLLLFTHKVMFDSCDPMNCNLPGSSIHGVFQARILEWVAIAFSREYSWPASLVSPALTKYTLPQNHQGSPKTTLSLKQNDFRYKPTFLITHSTDSQMLIDRWAAHPSSLLGLLGKTSFLPLPP